jgi:hypothetical protein
MNKEELLAAGWEILYSGPCDVSTWGAYMIHLRHSSGRKVSGYGADEQESLHDAADIIKTPLEATHEVSR